jgi:hypothetical protein
MPYAYFDSILGSGYVTKKNKKKREVCVAITIGFVLLL